MKSSVTNVLVGLGIITIGVGIAAAGIYIGETDDEPGAAPDIAPISWLPIVPRQGWFSPC